MATNGVNFSSATLPKQWQYVKHNLRDMGILNQIEADCIEAKAKMTVDNFSQCPIDAEFLAKGETEEDTSIRKCEIILASLLNHQDCILSLFMIKLLKNNIIARIALAH